MTGLVGNERARFFVAERFDGLECLTATFRSHRYAPHTHDTYAVGGILAGCETWNSRGARHYAGAGDVVFNNPHDVHDGAPYGEGYSYRMTYPSIALIRRIAVEVTGNPHVGTPFFPRPQVCDPQGVALFTLAHRAIEAGGDALAADEQLYRFYAHCLVRHAVLTPEETGREARAVARVRDLLCERYADDLTLDELAREARLSRHHLIRAFRREMGLTPHAFLVDRRVIAARCRLKRGETVAAVASAVGFCDQAHLTRAFKARLGVTPGAFRQAFLP
ncbi:AraC family transcriptional regulator [Chelatococcus sp. SYSU_G07232]|uniref:AraC family transcriptional regulator n=1 Tax=Chelatococcus albus TaxID=3047466 RepID=A0ABT7AGW5_9HYPH|nr:AraC family transcriptional regulator [Chelatococcus sp. SYSU_G07232]MDJ1158599.1 AraC family transcriptional regulator [Chelatococcus sp. SYSU_G07232]